MIQQILAIWSLVSAFSLPSLYIWKFSVHILLKHSLKDLEHVKVRVIVWYGSLNILWHCLSLGLKWKLTFPILWTPLSFPNLLTYWVQHITASSFRILNSSPRIAKLLLALLVVMLPKIHLTSHCRVSGSRWVTTPSWLSSSLRPFLYSSSMYSCHLFIISSSSWSLSFLS